MSIFFSSNWSRSLLRYGLALCHLSWCLYTLFIENSCILKLPYCSTVENSMHIMP
uniref:Uncharacterized protein n=1 Tax=Rhizophora mucronata TaxID=61149 RepID=A0A2P2NMX2_RHIMU